MALPALTGCTDTRRDGKLSVVVSVPPMAEFVRRLVPGADVHVLIRPGQSCHAFDLRPSDVAKVRSADVIVLIGLGLEHRAQPIFDQHAKGARVWTFADAVGIKDPHAGHSHAHDDHDHAHHTDSHLWLDAGLVLKALPSLAEVLEEGARAENLVDAKTLPVADGVVSRSTSLAGEVESCDAEVAALLAPCSGQSMVTHHDSFGRFAERYGLKIACVIRPIATSETTAEQLTDALEAIKRENSRAIFVEPQFSPQAAERIAERAGVAIGTLDPVGNEDWFSLMRSVAQEIKRSLCP